MVGRASESLFKDEFTLFLEALFRPGGTDLAFASVLLVYCDCARITQRNGDDGRKRERERSIWVGESFLLTSRIEGD